MSEIDKITEAKKELGSFISKLDRSRHEIDDLELDEEEKEALKELRESRETLRKIERDIEEKGLFSFDS